MQYRSRRERAEGRMKLLGLLAVLVVIGLLAWFYSMGGQEPVTTVTVPVTAQATNG